MAQNGSTEWTCPLNTDIILQDMAQNGCLLVHLGQIHPLDIHRRCVAFRSIFPSFLTLHQPHFNLLSLSLLIFNFNLK